MTGQNKQAQRIAIKHRPLHYEFQIRKADYFPCPKCGTMMNTERRAESHCRGER